MRTKHLIDTLEMLGISIPPQATSTEIEMAVNNWVANFIGYNNIGTMEYNGVCTAYPMYWGTLLFEPTNKRIEMRISMNIPNEFLGEMNIKNHPDRIRLSPLIDGTTTIYIS